jgi:hypothetical protein
MTDRPVARAGTARVRLAPHAVLLELVAETVLLDVRTGRFHRVAAPDGARLAHALAAHGPVPVDELIGGLADDELVELAPAAA